MLGKQEALKYISLLEIVRYRHKNNPIYNTSEYLKLLEKRRSSSFAVTVKQWATGQRQSEVSLSKEIRVAHLLPNDCM